MRVQRNRRPLAVRGCLGMGIAFSEKRRKTAVARTRVHGTTVSATLKTPQDHFLVNINSPQARPAETPVQQHPQAFGRGGTKGEGRARRPVGLRPKSLQTCVSLSGDEWGQGSRAFLNFNRCLLLANVPDWQCVPIAMSRVPSNKRGQPLHGPTGRPRPCSSHPAAPRRGAIPPCRSHARPTWARRASRRA